MQGVEKLTSNSTVAPRIRISSFHCVLVISTSDPAPRDLMQDSVVPSHELLHGFYVKITFGRAYVAGL